MKTITIRDIEAALASTNGSSALVREAGGTPASMRWHDLDHLAGGWGDAEAKAFQEKLRIFERIDEGAWL